MDVFKSKLKSDGIVYLAAKTLYFGVGGSLREFEDVIRRDDTFETSVVFTLKENVVREILKIQFKSRSE